MDKIVDFNDYKKGVATSYTVEAKESPVRSSTAVRKRPGPHREV